MKFNIPSIGDRIILTEDWNLTILNEAKNVELLYILTGKKYSYKWYGDKMKSIPITIGKDSLLEVSRIYIRHAKKEFDSVSFKIRKLGNPDVKLKKKSVLVATFWASLGELKNLEFNSVEKEMVN